MSTEPERYSPADVDALLLEDAPESHLSLDQIRHRLGDDHPLVRRLSLVAELDRLPGLYDALVREAHPGARTARMALYSAGLVSFFVTEERLRQAGILHDSCVRRSQGPCPTTAVMCCSSCGGRPDPAELAFVMGLDRNDGPTLDDVIG